MMLLNFNIRLKKLPSSSEERKKRYVGIGNPHDYLLEALKKNKKQKGEKTKWKKKDK